MPYIIDGHNLIPHIPGLSLADLDDENGLLSILQKFANQRRSRIEVFFDQASVVQSGKRNFGQVAATFIPAGTTADQAIMKQLKSLGKAAKNWTVVSSDREVLAEARSYHCQTLNSPDFAGLLRSSVPSLPAPGGKTDSPEVSPDETSYWLDQFSKK